MFPAPVAVGTGTAFIVADIHRVTGFRHHFSGGAVADLSAEGRRKAAGKGQAMRGGRFPITNRTDLSNAIDAVGRAKGGEAGRKAVRRFIIKRARALGLSSMIPDSWNSDGSLKSGS